MFCDLVLSRELNPIVNKSDTDVTEWAATVCVLNRKQPFQNSIDDRGGKVLFEEYQVAGEAVAMKMTTKRLQGRWSRHLQKRNNTRL